MADFPSSPISTYGTCSATVSNFPAVQPISGTVTAVNSSISTATKTVTSVLLMSVQICAANPNRKGFAIWNNGSNSAYVSFESPATSAAPVQIIATFTTWYWMYPVAYTGAMYAIRNAGSGNLVVWEF